MVVGGWSDKTRGKEGILKVVVQFLIKSGHFGAFIIDLGIIQCFPQTANREYIIEMRQSYKFCDKKYASTPSTLPPNMIEHYPRHSTRGGFTSIYTLSYPNVGLYAVR